jgi:hypothetical protein
MKEFVTLWSETREEVQNRMDNATTVLHEIMVVGLRHAVPAINTRPMMVNREQRCLANPHSIHLSGE